MHGVSGTQRRVSLFPPTLDAAVLRDAGMREELMERLAEPQTGSPLRLRATRSLGGRVEEGSLVSETTGRIYPILRGIPRFVSPKDNDNYTGSFGRQWNLFRGVQLDSATERGYSRGRFDDETRWTAADLDGKWVLDAGCGAGRFAEVAASRGANLVALDYSSAVEAVAKTLFSFPRADVVQGDLLSPPFRPGAFDFAYCIGVAQHTPDPAAAVRGVLSCVRRDGRFSFTIYARQPWTRFSGKYLVRPLTRRLPQPTLLRAIERVMPALFPLADRLFRMPRVGRLARYLLPIATYVHTDELTRDQRYREAVLDTFDALAPRYDTPMTWREVEDIFHVTGAANWRFQTKVPINVVGAR